MKVTVEWADWSVYPMFRVMCTQCGAVLNRLDGKSPIMKLEESTRYHASVCPADKNTRKVE